MVTTRRQAYEIRVQTKMVSLQTRYFGTQSLSLLTPIPVPPTFRGMSFEEVEEAEDDFYQLWQFHYVVLFAAHRRSCLRMLAEDAVLAEDEKARKSSKKYCRYPAKDWMRSKNPKPNSKFVVSASSEESSLSDRTMDDFVIIGTVTANNPSVSYGLSIPLTFFQKEVMNALKCGPGQLNGNIFEIMRVCEVLNQKWRDGGIARQFVADDVLKYCKFKYVKDRKSGYLFSDSAMPKFFDFKSSGRPWCDYLVMVRGNCMQVPGEPALELIYKNFNEKPNPKAVADTSSLFDVVSREGIELNKIFACAMGTSSSLVRRPRIKKTVLPSEQTAPVQIPPVGTEGVVADVNMAPRLKKQKKEYGKDIRASSKGLSVAWKSAAEVLKLAAANRGELFRQHDAEKAALEEQFE
ncbi:hypothetical protein GIB67_009506 [Kingdonia uniflora]|uniref:Uncharacterized protein n=1 Tax=Kingdonia uniflora TaxID=39325 RepID=A0A7J7NVY5_9MAGN|nr:hypothetical protein GIB67_009506 [Kingdonia uniflora]